MGREKEMGGAEARLGDWEKAGLKSESGQGRDGERRDGIGGRTGAEQGKGAVLE